ncbi:hypothetical protein DFH27DRAFT_607738 [Peziza echinospora]|nr:hypothetical protein DFH27DRAFT_607738 [Peziza echinospora]
MNTGREVGESSKSPGLQAPAQRPLNPGKSYVKAARNSYMPTDSETIDILSNAFLMDGTEDSVQSVHIIAPPLNNCYTPEIEHSQHDSTEFEQSSSGSVVESVASATQNTQDADVNSEAENIQDEEVNSDSAIRTKAKGKGKAPMRSRSNSVATLEILKYTPPSREVCEKVGVAKLAYTSYHPYLFTIYENSGIPRRRMAYELVLTRVPARLEHLTLDQFKTTIALVRIDKPHTILTHRERLSAQGWIDNEDSADLIELLEMLEPQNKALENIHRLEHADAYEQFEEALGAAYTWIADPYIKQEDVYADGAPCDASIEVSPPTPQARSIRSVSSSKAGNKICCFFSCITNYFKKKPDPKTLSNIELVIQPPLPRLMKDIPPRVRQPKPPKWQLMCEIVDLEVSEGPKRVKPSERQNIRLFPTLRGVDPDQSGKERHYTGHVRWTVEFMHSRENDIVEWSFEDRAFINRNAEFYTKVPIE